MKILFPVLCLAVYGGRRSAFTHLRPGPREPLPLAGGLARAVLRVVVLELGVALGVLRPDHGVVVPRGAEHFARAHARAALGRALAPLRREPLELAGAAAHALALHVGLAVGVALVVGEDLAVLGGAVGGAALGRQPAAVLALQQRCTSLYREGAK